MKDDPPYSEPFSDIYSLKLSSFASQFLTHTLRVDVTPTLNICEPDSDTGVSSSVLYWNVNQKKLY